MAVPIFTLPQQPGLSETLGQSLGTGIGGLVQGVGGFLQNLAQLKMQDVAQRQQSTRTASALQELLGLSPEQAQAVSGAPESILKEFTKQKIMEPQQAAYLEALQSILGNTGESKFLQDLSDKSQNFGTSQISKDSKAIQLPKKGLNAQQATQLAKLSMDKQKEIKREEYQAKKLALEEKKLEATSKKEMTKEQRLEQHHIDKETKPLYDEINKGYKAAIENDKRLNRMEELVNKGNLGIPFVNSALKSLSKGIFGFGIDLTSLMTADAQEFDKLSTQFASGAKDVFPGRVTNADLDVYMRQIPNLSQSAAGIKRIIFSMQAANKAAKLRKKAMDEIIRENKGLRPSNMENLIEDKIGSQLDILAKEFINAPHTTERIGGGIVRY